MSDKGSTSGSGKYRQRYQQRYQQPIDNPEIPNKKDWWSDMCKAAGEKNYWDKDKNKLTTKRN